MDIDQIHLTDIAIGDVWFCSGQSNMVIPMERVKEKYPEEIATAEYPLIRNFFVPTLADLGGPHKDLPKGNWLAATPQNVLSFGAASYFFARELYEKYRVPIGIINSSVGGTPIQAWISKAGLKQFPDELSRLQIAPGTTAIHPQPTVDLGGQGRWYDPPTSHSVGSPTGYPVIGTTRG